MNDKRPIYTETYSRRQRLVTIAAIVLALALVVLGVTWWLNRNPRPSSRTYPVMGVRLDQSDGPQDFSSFSANMFVYLKATEGASYVDDQFAINYDRAQGQGLPLGVYHYFSFDSTPTAQAQHFISKVSAVGTLPIGIYLVAYKADLPSDAQLTASVNTFMQQVATRFNRNFVIMGTPAMLARVKTLPTTVGRWVISTSRPKAATFWQYSNGAPLPGTDDPRYQSAVFVGSQAAFAAATNKTVR
ncbi:GH25 family lysozyme [Lacticaseibacillus brantae]|uniref:Lyzozyme M1 n=1 Tax=Lacticaseibacillus brantae DSM 23927 TaxID=1423727 RepID=A0A0R2B2V0_9LACO|nr:GH25 family lysozyme [Lacticaseibacillus brantae]KRM73074.1 lyzozyme M1 [Lacticaseibacillus brantae DSM 23927]